MFLKRKIEKIIAEEMKNISEKIISEVKKGEFPKSEYEKFFLLMRMSIRLNLYNKKVFRKLRIKMEEDLKNYGSD